MSGPWPVLEFFGDRWLSIDNLDWQFRSSEWCFHVWMVALSELPRHRTRQVAS